MNILSATGLFVALMTLPAIVGAQPRTRPDPADPKAAVSAVVYESPLKRYQSPGDTPVSSWKGVNDAVEKAGGWKSYAREAQEPLPAPRAPASPVPQAKPQPVPATKSGDTGHKH
jgi:hypothetical protein